MSFLIKNKNNVKTNIKVVPSVVKTPLKTQPQIKVVQKPIKTEMKKPAILLPRVLPSTREIQFAEEMSEEVKAGIVWNRVWWNKVMIGYVKGKDNPTKIAEIMWPKYAGKMNFTPVGR